MHGILAVVGKPIYNTPSDSKTRSQGNTKLKPQVAIREPLDPNGIFVKVNGHPPLALIDLQTIGGDRIRAQLVYLYKPPLVKIEPKTLATAI